ncbi:Glycosyltransferase [Bacteroidales bacterium CF]|nr:Glycosyltransferase [Bacteroidales bacterium CF]
MMAKLRFRILFHRKLDLKNPKDLNEKILFLSLYTDTSKWAECADKYSVRKYIVNCGLSEILVDLYGKWDKPEDIDWSILPNSFVLKTNNGCGTVLLVDNKSKLDLKVTTILLREWLDRDISNETAEFHYRRIKPCIIAEEMLIPSGFDEKISSTIIDYKIWCFNGKVDSILVCSNRRPDGCDLSVYDSEWNYYPEASVFDKHHQERKFPVPKPAKLELMLEVAETLSTGFPEVRVDLYYINDRIYFGEMTFTSFGGTMTYYSPNQLLKMGQKIDLSTVKKTR